MRILIVDDSRIMRNIVKNTLRALNYPHEVFLEASDGHEAWEILDAHEISLLLVDWNMPSLNGIELVKRLRGVAKFTTFAVNSVGESTSGYENVPNGTTLHWVVSSKLSSLPGPGAAGL